MLVDHLHILFGKMSTESFCPFFNQVVCFCLFRAAPTAYESSQSSSRIGAIAGPTPQLQQHQIWAVSAAYTTAHGNVWSFNPLSKARYRTCVLEITSQMHLLSHNGNSLSSLFILSWVVWAVYVFWIFLIGHIICKYFLQFSRLSFHFVGHFHCCAKAFHFHLWRPSNGGIFSTKPSPGSPAWKAHFFLWVPGALLSSHMRYNSACLISPARL